MTAKKPAPEAREVSRYRTTELAMWGDKKFLALSKPQPNGQTIWQFLLTGPDTTPIPGIVVCKPMAIAVYYDWCESEALLAAFLKAFGEVCTAGLVEVDKTAGLMWLPGATKAHRSAKPHSPNVVLGWKKFWPEIPECSLKYKAQEALRTYVEGLGEAYGEAFAKAFGQVSRNREQEQEQEQEKNSSLARPVAERAKSPSRWRPTAAQLEAVYSQYPKKTGKAKGLAKLQRYTWTEPEFEQLQACVETMERQWKGADTQFCPGFEPFVNGKRWMDDEWPMPRTNQTSGTGHYNHTGAEEYAGGDVEI